jgi:hypothetical protein
MPTLQSQIQAFADTFANSLMQALRTTSLDEILAHTGGGHAPRKAAPAAKAPAKAAGGARKARLPRRNLGDIENVAAQIVAFVAKHPSGARAETIRTGLGLDIREWPKPLAAALAGNKLRKTGAKRSTTYFAK